MRKLYFILFLATVFTKNAGAQSFAINTDGSTANGSALLDVKSIDKGLLIPRMNKTQRNGIAAPATGLLVFQNAPDSIGFYYYDGSKWNWMAAINGNADTLAWKRNGNSGTDTAVNFLGTIDSMPLRFKLNNTWAGQWDAKHGNYFIGKDAGYKTKPHISSIFLTKDGWHNIAIGTGALYSNTRTSYCIAIGDSVLFDYNNPYVLGHNIGIGYRALRYTTTGNSNLAIGKAALSANTTGNRNTAIGSNSLTDNISGDYNTACGGGTLSRNTSGSSNTALGYGALLENTIGNGNVAIGYDALHSSTTGDNNIGVGEEALYNNTTADNNIANGYQALYDNTTGEDNIANGYRSLYNNTTGINNIATGNQALRTNTIGQSNIANGYFALYNNLNGNYNIANGYQAMYANTSGEYNIATGWIALTSNTIGNNNIALGRRALEVNTSGNNNVAIGARALELNTNTDYNTAIGAFALQTPSTGFHNTAIGYSSDVTLISASNATALGYNATAPASNYVRIGNTAVTSIFGAVNFNTSDGRFKTNIQSNVPGLDFIMGLRPVTYHFEKEKYSRFIGEKQDKEYVQKLQTQDGENKMSTGFIAQEVEALAKKLNYDFDGLYKPQSDKDAYGLGYQQFVTPLIKAVQEQQQLILQQQQVIKDQQLLFNGVLKRLAALENK